VTDLLAARAQMAMSLAFHIIFAMVGMAMPLLMVLAEGRWLRRTSAAAVAAIVCLWRRRLYAARLAVAPAARRKPDTQLT